MKACRFSSESGAERPLHVLMDATDRVADSWHEVEESDNQGLCYDGNPMLTQAIDEQLEALH